MFDLDDDEEINIQESEGGEKLINDTGTETNNNTLLNFPDHLKENLTNGHKDFQQVHDPSDPFIPKIEEYLQKNVRGILQPMVNAVLSEKPKDPVNNIINN